MVFPSELNVECWNARNIFDMSPRVKLNYIPQFYCCNTIICLSYKRYHHSSRKDSTIISLEIAFLSLSSNFGKLGGWTSFKLYRIIPLINRLCFVLWFLILSLCKSVGFGFSVQRKLLSLYRDCCYCWVELNP